MKYPSQYRADKGLQEFEKGLHNLDIHLPVHQAALRAQLIAVHRYERQSPCTILRALRKGLLRIRFWLPHSRLWRWGAAAGLVGGFVLLLSLFLRQSAMTQTPALPLAMAAARKVQYMSPQHIAHLSGEYASLDACLAQAMRSKDLHIASDKEVRILVPASTRHEHPTAKVYLVFREDRYRHRIVIALDATNTPLYALDADNKKGRDNV